MAQYLTEYDHIHQKFLAMESDLHLFSLEFDEVPIWERIRVKVAAEIFQQLGLWGQIDVEQKYGFREYTRGAYLLLRNLVHRNPFLAEPSQLLFVGHPRRQQVMGTWKDIYCDPLHEHFQYDYVHLEEPYHNRHLHPAQTENLRYIDLIEHTGIILRQTGLVHRSLSAAERRPLERIERKIHDDFGVDVDVVDLVQTVLQSRKSTKPLYDALLVRLDPDVVVVVASSGKETFIEACHDAGVPVAELQHGQINPYDLQYSFPGSRTKEAFPDYLLTFGTFWNDAASYPIDERQIFSVGFPYLEQQQQRLADVEERNQVLFISTGEVGLRLSRLAVELSEQSKLEMDIVYKLHPGEFQVWKQEYPWLEESDVEVIDTSRSLYRLCAESRAQVGVNSTAVYEGLAFGLDTYLVKMPTVEWTMRLVENGDVILVESVDDLVDRLANARSRGVDTEKYFKSNSFENLSSVLTELVNHENGH